MKKSILLLFAFTLLCKAQETKQNATNNEIRVELTRLMVSSGFHVSYERFLNKDFSFGSSILLYGENQDNFDYDNELQQLHFKFEPYARYSLSKSVKRYFYLELFSSIIGGKVDNGKRFSDGVYGYYDVVNKRFTTVTFGASLGYKFYFKKKLCFDVIFGSSSRIAGNKELKIVPKFGIGTGYRF